MTKTHEFIIIIYRQSTDGYDFFICIKVQLLSECKKKVCFVYVTKRTSSTIIDCD